MLYVLNLLLGFVLIEVKSSYPERFFNLLSRNKIAFWGMKNMELGVVRMCVSVSDFMRLRPIVRRAMCRVHILRKVGLPFVLQRLRTRKVLIIGALVFAISAWILTSFIWIIDIDGCVTSSPSHIREHLAYNGIKIGARNKGIDYAAIKNDILLNLPELINITINIQGSHAKVTVHERSRAPEIIDYSIPSNIIADFDGIISKITVTSGTPEVSVGDTVTRGTLLASGYTTGRHGTTVLQRAIAEIYAKTWEQQTVIMPHTISKKVYTGRKKTLFTLILGTHRINLQFRGGNLYTSCDKIIKRSNLSFPGGLTMPIALERTTLHEYETESYTPKPDIIFEYLRSRAEKYIETPLKIINTKTEIKNGAVFLTLDAECERKIGTEQMIPKGE